MNSHLNVFNTYTKVERVYQLENDLTRAFAICMQEDPLFFYEVLKTILNNDSQLDLLFSNTEIENKVNINIQINSSNITSYEKIIAVSLSEVEMDVNYFFHQTHLHEYDPICDIVIELNDTVIIIEAKRDGVDCTAQLYNQAFNIVKRSNDIGNFNDFVEARDLNWRKLMQIASKVSSFQKTVSQVNRFTLDFINLVKGHNPSWLPETPIAALSSIQEFAIRRRIESAINYLEINDGIKKLTYKDRLGLEFNKLWAQEILCHISDNGDLVITVYAGNTKAQGLHIFSRPVEIAKELIIDNVSYPLHKGYHIKISNQSYITGLWFSDADLVTDSNLYSNETFFNYAGKNLRGKDWDDIEDLFNRNFLLMRFDWREYCQWYNKVINTQRNQIYLSFGYELYIVIPFEKLKKVDNSATNLNGLVDLIRSSYRAFENDLIK